MQDQNSTESIKNQDPLVQSNTTPPEPDLLPKLARKRRQSNQLADSFYRLGYKNKAVRVRDCGTQLEMAYIFAEQRWTLHRANFCKERLCPMCAWQRTRQIFSEVSAVMNVVQQERVELVPVFLTLTVKNCKAVKLCGVLDSMFQGWNRFMANKRMKRLIPGWFRALEITYNEDTDTYHPHLHAILLIPPDYFNSKDYMTTRDWVKAWRQAMKLTYNPVCDIREISAEGKEMGAAVAEVAKYTVKDTDYLKDDTVMTDKLVEEFGTAIRGRRLYAYGGVMKEAAKRLDIKVTDDIKQPGDVVNRDGVVLRKDVDYVLMLYRWNIGLTRYKFDGNV